jgi:hypothetical protein
MRKGSWKFGTGILLMMGALAGWGSTAYPNGDKQISNPSHGPGKIFLYTAKKFGVPILRACIRIEDGCSEQGRPLYQIHASVDSLHLGFLFRMKNRFLSTMQAETCSPVRYVKEIDQEGILIEKKKYLQTLTFDFLNKKVVAEKREGKERQEFHLSSGTHDPLSMFARCYLKEEIRPEENIRMSIFDGVKLRQMVFYAKKGKVKSKMYGEVEAVCLESSTPFSTFEEREGKIRIWYTANGEKIPVLIELGLPIGNIKFELESVEKSRNGLKAMK